MLKKENKKIAEADSPPRPTDRICFHTIAQPSASLKAFPHDRPPYQVWTKICGWTNCILFWLFWEFKYTDHGTEKSGRYRLFCMENDSAKTIDISCLRNI